MRVLISGHRGYVGSVLVPVVRKRGYDVIGVDSGLFDDCALSPTDTLAVDHAIDIRDLSAAHFQNIDAVVHLAGLSNDPLGDLSPELTHAINEKAAVRVAHLARDAGVRRFIFASTCSVYGAAGDALVSEASTPRPVTPYGCAKLAAERNILALKNKTFEPVSLRFATAYGDAPMLRFDLVVNNLLAWATTTQKVRLKSVGLAWRPLIHVRAIAEAIICALEEDANRVSGSFVNVGDPEGNYRVREIAEHVRQSVPGSSVVFAADASPDSRSYRVDFSRMERVLPSFQYQWPLAAMLEQLGKTIADYALTPDDFEGSQFDRRARLLRLLAAGELDDTYRPVRKATRQRAIFVEKPLPADNTAREPYAQ